MVKESRRLASDGRWWISFAFDRAGLAEVEQRVRSLLSPESADHVIDIVWFGQDSQDGLPQLHIPGVHPQSEMYCEVSLLAKERAHRFSTFMLGDFRIRDWQSDHGRFLTGSGCFSSHLETFRLLGDLIKRFDLAKLPLCRTWFYLPDIPYNYSKFNEARDRFFDDHGITFFPASTGVGVAGDQGVFRFECSTGLQRGHDSAGPMTLQCQPVEYGPRFRRANIVSSSQYKELLISGISSVQRDGRSMEFEAYEDVEFALASFTEILESNRASWSDLVSVYLYAVDEDVLQFAASAVEKRTGLVVPRVLNRICRSDLRFEIEGRAIVYR